MDKKYVDLELEKAFVSIWKYLLVSIGKSMQSIMVHNKVFTLINSFIINQMETKVEI